MSQTITIYRGSDIRHKAVVMDSAQNPIDLTGYDVRLFEASPELGATLTVTDAAAGEIEVSAQWQDAWKTGRFMSYRIQISLDGRETAWPQVWIQVR